jgi:hypothetical protein
MCITEKEETNLLLAPPLPTLFFRKRGEQVYITTSLPSSIFFGHAKVHTTILT